MDPSRHFADAAIAWALSRLGETAYSGRCLAFVEDAYEHANGIEVFGADSARGSADLYGTQPYQPSHPPRPGSLVFYDTEGPTSEGWRDWGHVGIALGDGRVVHAWSQVRVDAAEDVQTLRPPDGWTAPRLRGWTDVERFLEGHRPRVRTGA